ncbi:MAG: hypothetical protein QOE58_927 [Actinomycetota bacterium]|jgi:hypothetical protein|nr:hypothetical protein [Actinomycetota bacterium]
MNPLLYIQGIGACQGGRIRATQLGQDGSDPSSQQRQLTQPENAPGLRRRQLTPTLAVAARWTKERCPEVPIVRPSIGRLSGIGSIGLPPATLDGMSRRQAALWLRAYCPPGAGGAQAA